MTALRSTHGRVHHEVGTPPGMQAVHDGRGALASQEESLHGPLGQEERQGRDQNKKGLPEMAMDRVTQTLGYLDEFVKRVDEKYSEISTHQNSKINAFKRST